MGLQVPKFNESIDDILSRIERKKKFHATLFIAYITIMLLFFFLLVTKSNAAFTPKAPAIRITAVDTSKSSTIGALVSNAVDVMFIVKGGPILATIGTSGCKALRTQSDTAFKSIPIFSGVTVIRRNNASTCVAVIAMDTLRTDTVYYQVGTWNP